MTRLREMQLVNASSSMTLSLSGKLMLFRAEQYCFEVFVPDDAFEGGATRQSSWFEDCELIGESDTREGTAFIECCLS